VREKKERKGALIVGNSMLGEMVAMRTESEFATINIYPPNHQ